MVTITSKGSDLKVEESNEVNYYPIDDIRQRAIGNNVELYLDGNLIKSFKSDDFLYPSGTAVEVADAISLISTIGGGVVVYGAKTTVNVSSVSTEIVPENVNRKALILTNSNDNDVWISIGDDPVRHIDMRIPRRSSFIMDSSTVSTQQINGICQNNRTSNVTYQEAT